jgi:hypothetical protein
MARRKASDPGLTLFPFLSVLAAVMGTLILIISGMSQLALASPKQGVDVQAFDPGKKNPIFVECRKHGLRIYADDPTTGKYKWVPSSEIGWASSDWSDLTRRLEHDQTRYVMLLVRANGVRTYNEVRASVNVADIDIGYEPLFGTGPVRFRMRTGHAELAK